MIAVGDGHQLVGQAEVEMALIKIAVPVVVRVVPGEVHLAPLAVDLHGVPSVAVSLYAAVGDAGGIQQLGVDALVTFARALMSGEAAFRAAPVKVVVVFQLVERPVVQPQGARIVGAVGLGVAFVDCGFHDGADRRIGVVVCACKHVCAQIVHAGRLVHQVKAQIVSAASGHFELVIVRCAFAGVLLPLVAAGVGNAFVATIGIHIRRRIHAEPVCTASACCRYMEGSLLTELRVVPLDGEHDVAALRGGAVLVVRSCVRRLDFKRDFAGAAVILVGCGRNGGCLSDGDVVLVGDGVLVARHR